MVRCAAGVGAELRRVAAARLQRRLRVPDSLAGVRDVAAFLRRLCSRFGIKPNLNTWSLSLTMRAMRAQANAGDYAFLCSGVSAHEVLAAVEAVAPLGIQLAAFCHCERHWQ